MGWKVKKKRGDGEQKRGGKWDEKLKRKEEIWRIKEGEMGRKIKKEKRR